ncbi:hypothetical protein NDU88_003621 [Pleurodeles waltl]|uniref:Uncharacterized protein n=1 Tax=Pleurodeles waltl TaxID=8319 RepID=A0AAV7T5P7_PLEWA|nr:hypothetical protein NDU88_003621 [Pleurodeles waltl]
MRAISGQSGARERVGDRGLPLGATEPPLGSRCARTRLAAEGEVRGLPRDSEPGPCGVGPRPAFRGAGEPGGPREACACSAADGSPDLFLRVLANCVGPLPGPVEVRGPGGDQKTPGETAHERGERTAPPVRDPAMDSTHTNGSGPDRGPVWGIQQADTMEEPTVINQAHPHIERKKAGPDLCARNQQQIGFSQQVEPGQASDREHYGRGA